MGREDNRPCHLSVGWESQVQWVLTVLNSNPSLNRQIEDTVSLQQLFFNTKMTSVPSAKDCMMSSSERNRFQTLLGLSRLFARWLECYFSFNKLVLQWWGDIFVTQSFQQVHIKILQLDSGKQQTEDHRHVAIRHRENKKFYWHMQNSTWKQNWCNVYIRALGNDVFRCSLWWKFWHWGKYL